VTSAGAIEEVCEALPPGVDAVAEKGSKPGALSTSDAAEVPRSTGQPGRGGPPPWRHV
jgi:hypothetical protein